MRSLLVCVVALLAYVSANSKDALLRSNQLMDSCDDCQSLVDRFVVASQDNFKLEQLKSTLRVACDHTPYANECKVVVKNLQTVIRRMQPYIKDRRVVCRKMKMCDSEGVSDLARLTLLVAKKHLNRIDGTKDTICAECQLAATGFAKTIGEKNGQNIIHKFVENTVCGSLGRHEQTCLAIVGEMLPLIFNEIENLFANSKNACNAIGMCHENIPKVTLKHKPAPALSEIAKKFWAATPPLKTSVGHVRMECLPCKVLMDSILIELRSNSTSYKIGMDLKDAVCPKLPENMLLGCDDFLNLYAPTVVYMTAMQPNSTELCKSILHTCENEQLVGYLSEEEKNGLTCEACKGLTLYVKDALTQPDFLSDLISGLENYGCTHFPGTFKPLCENLIRSFVPKVVQKAIVAVSDETLCTKKLHVC